MRTSSNSTRLWLVALVAAAFLAGGAARSVVGAEPRPGVVHQTSAGNTGEPTGPSGPGPSRMMAGVPVGYARSEEGARAAAVGYVRTGQLMLDASPAGVRAATQAMSAQGAAEGQLRDLSGRLAVVGRNLEGATGPVIYRQGVLATRVDAYSPDRARVSVWHVGVLSAPGVAPPQSGWATSSFELVWEDGDWKVWSESVVPGPAPVLNDDVAPASASQLEADLSGFGPQP